MACGAADVGMNQTSCVHCVAGFGCCGVVLAAGLGWWSGVGGVQAGFGGVSGRMVGAVFA